MGPHPHAHTQTYTCMMQAHTHARTHTNINVQMYDKMKANVPISCHRYQGVPRNGRCWNGNVTSEHSSKMVVF